MEKKLGKIQRCEFGFGGYQDAQIGISFAIGGDGWGVGDFWGYWNTERSAGTKWTEADRLTGLGSTVMRISALLEAAKVESVSKLKGVPVECTFDGNALKSWRVLAEVL